MRLEGYEARGYKVRGYEGEDYEAGVVEPFAGATTESYGSS